MSRRWMLIAGFMFASHAMCVAMAEHLPEAVAPAIAASVYLPLWWMAAVGLPVFGNAESGGWAAPSMFGWAAASLWWLFCWSGVALAGRALVGRLRSP